MSKSKVILVNPSLTKEKQFGESAKYTSHTLPPLGLCYLAAVLREKDFDVKLLDAPGLFLSMGETVDEIVKLKPDYVCISATIISIYPAVDLVNELKKKINAKIILGGPHVSAVPEETMKRFPEFEVAILGEGELTLLELIETFEKKGDLGKVDGLIFKKDDKLIKTKPRELIKDLDTLPLPAYDLLPKLAENYRPSKLTYHRLPSTSVITSRGCPFQCIFCDRSVFGNKWRFHGADYIIKLIKWLHDDFGIIDFYFTDDHFTVNKERLKKICNVIIDSKLDITWSTIGRLDSVDSEMLELMKRAGCKQIAYGIESGSQEVLDFIKKKLTIDQIKKGIKLTKDVGLEAKGLFMVGAPIETKETLEQTMNLIKEIKLDYVSMSAFTPIPGSEIYKDATKYGEFDDDWKKMNLWDVIFVPKGLTKEYLTQFVKRCSGGEIKTAEEIKAFEDKECLDHFMSHFEGVPSRLKKYMEVLLLQGKASPYCYQDKKDYRFIALELTTRCNLDCKWCYRRDLPSNYLGKDADFEKLKKLIPQLKGFKKIHFGGLGEFLLYPSLIEVIKLCKGYVPEIVLTTNGTLLTKEMTHKLAGSGLTYLEVSIDAFVGDTNKEFRGLPASLGKIHEDLKYFSEYTNIPIQINSVVSNLNIDSLYNAMDFMKDIPSVTIFHTIKLFMTEAMKKEGITGVSDEEHTKLLEHLKKEAEKLNLKVKLSPDTLRVKLDPVISMKNEHNICFIPFEDPAIDVDGNLLLCCRLNDLKFGNVYEKGFDSVWNGEQALKFRKDMLCGKPHYRCAMQCALKMKK